MFPVCMKQEIKLLWVTYLFNHNETQDYSSKKLIPNRNRCLFSLIYLKINFILPQQTRRTDYDKYF